MDKTISPLRIAVFDLNQTVYNKSSKDEFFKFIVSKKPRKLLNIFQLGIFTLLKEFKFTSKTNFKENFFHYLDHLPPDTLREYALEYWSAEWPHHFNQALLQRIKELRQEGTKVYFATGTLDIYVQPLFDKLLKVDGWLATRTQYSKGRYHIIGRACKDDEKIRRLDQVLQHQAYIISEAYSDKKEAILIAANKAYIVKNGQVEALN